MKSLEELKAMIEKCIESKVPNKAEYENYDFEEYYSELTKKERKEKIEEWYNRDIEYYNEYKNYNFLAYKIKDDKACLCETYQDAANICDEGGQVLVIDKDKVYNYKVKTDEEYSRYLSYKIRQENRAKMDRYGL